MHTTDTQRNRFLRLLFILAGLAFLGPNALAKQSQVAAAKALIPATQAAASAGQAQPPQAGANQPAPDPQAPQTLHLLVGRSLLITSPTRIKRVSIADPAIAESVVVSPTEVLINGKAPGGVSLIIWDEADQSQNFEVAVGIDVQELSEKIHEVFPAESVQIATSGTAVILLGKVSSAQIAEKVLEVVKNVTPKVTSFLTVPQLPTGQISLEVRFADVNRAGISQLGANFLRNFGSKMPMSTSTQQFAPPQLANGMANTFELSDLLNVFVFRPDIDLAATIKALQENNLLEILAQPNLLTESGKEANFLAGGEFPYPVLQSSAGGGGSNAITITFKEFGIRLAFTPTILEDGRIHLKVAPEVSSLDFTNAVTIQGFLLPALSTNRVTSEVELTDGQSFAIAGLLDNRVTEQFEKIPGIGDIPILGKLFQSRTLNKSKNELLVVITPRVVQPLAAVPPGPAFPQPFLQPAIPAGQKPAGQ